MPKRVGGTDDFKPKKPNRIDDFREGRRFSFRIGGDKTPVDECGKLEIPDYKRQKQDVGRKDGEAVLYSGEQLENYKKQYPRFERAIDLIPDGKIERGGNQVYLFCSKKSPTGYWEVTVVETVPTYFIEAGAPLQILCPVPFQITQVVSDGTSFIWTQLEGGRLAFVDAATDLNPVLHILDDVRDSRPIRFEVAVGDDPTVKDILIVYTTPTSDYDGLSFETAIASSDTDPARKVTTLRPGVPLPQYLQRGYVANPPNTFMATWDLPVAYPEYLIETVWQQNTTGEYVDVQHFPKLSHRSFTAQLNTHYRILSVFKTLGNDSFVDSQRYYFENGSQAIAIDDNLNGLSFSTLQATVTKIALNRVGLETPVDTYDGFSFAGLKSSSTSLPLDGISLESPTDIYDGFSFTGLKTTVTKTELGGIVIS